MGTKKTTPQDEKNLEDKLKKLTAQLDQERVKSQGLEHKLSQQPSFSFEWVMLKINEFKAKSKLPFLAQSTQKQVKKRMPNPVPVAQNVLNEDYSDDVPTYSKKLKTYKLDELEDIFLHIDKELYPEKYTALIEELKSRQ